MNKKIAFGLKLAVVNFALVAILGMLMRYKIAFPFDVFEQKHMQEAHSHFAFYGWTTLAIYIFMLRDLIQKIPSLKSKKYFLIIALNLLGAYGMLATFLYGGYYWLSIVFSTISLLSSFIFLFAVIKELRFTPTSWGRWYIGGLVFALLSSAGVFYMAYSMMTHRMSQQMYLGSTYYYLHFQYNGFFIFACMGILLSRLESIGISISKNRNRTAFLSLFIGTILTFGLSVLWAKMPTWIFLLIIAGSVLQTFGSLVYIGFVKKYWTRIKENWSSFDRFVLLYIGLAYVIKIILQLGSNFPALSKFAFGFRNIVIAYLHLVLLMCIGTFLLHSILSSGYFKKNKMLKIAFSLFLIGTFLNEFFLGINGILSIKYILLPNTQYILLGVSVVITAALLLILVCLKISRSNVKLPVEKTEIE